MAERPVVFDRAAAHLDAVRSHGLPEAQGYVHGGLFFGWAVDRGLVAGWVEDGAAEAFAAYRARRLSGPALLARLDGALIDDQFTDEGLAFVATYVDPRVGSYVDDWLREIARGLPSEYHVPDDAEHAARVAALLDRRFAEWRATWDGMRPDLRQDGGANAVPTEVAAPSVPIRSGIPLPGGPLGIRAARRETRAAVAAARAGDGWLVLLPVLGDEPVEVGVLARIERVAPAADQPEVPEVLLQCVARAELVRPLPDGRGVWRVLPEPVPSADEAARIEAVRVDAAEVARRRRVRGEPPGRIALAAVLPGPALLDVLAAELPATREERAIVLTAPDLASRVDVVAAVVLREP